MNLYTKTERILASKLFLIKKGQIFYNACITAMLAGSREVYSKEFVPISEAPNFLKHKFTPAFLKSVEENFQQTNYEALTIEISFENYFIKRLQELFQNNENAGTVGYSDFIPIYAQFDFLSNSKIEDLSKLHALLLLIWRLGGNNRKLHFIYKHLSENYYGVEIPLTSFNSFLKYLNRKKRETLPNGIIHGLYNKKSNNKELSDLMKDVLVLLALNINTHKSGYSIKEDLDHIIEQMPNASIYGIYSVSESKISKFLREPATKNILSYAKDNSVEFYRKVTGVMSFLRASAPLVRVYLDGYSFQVECKSQFKNPDRLIGFFISDDFSDYVIAHEIGYSENYNVVMSALERYFKQTNNAIPRELVMDKYTYRLISSNKNLMSLLDRYGIKKGRGIIVSSNANRKSRLERFFNTFQQKFMTSIIQYIGPSIKAKQTNAHPFRAFQIIIKKHVIDDFDLIITLNKLIRIHYNKEYVSQGSLSEVCRNTPEFRFLDYDHNPLCNLNASIIPTLFFELHRVKVKAGGILLKRNSNFHIYYLRDFDFINTYNGKVVDAYLDTNDISKVHVYECNTTNFINSISAFKILPVSEFDRSEEDRMYVKRFNKETRQLISQFEKELSQKEETVFTALNGRDLNFYSRLAKIKKEISTEQDLADKMNLIKAKTEPVLFHSNKSRRKGRSTSEETNLGFNITDTF